MEHPRTVFTPADRDGTLVDTGYRVGERLVYRTMRGPQTVVVLGPSPEPHEFLAWGGSSWERRFAFAPQIRVVREGEPETRWIDAPVRLLSRPIGDRIDAEIAATRLEPVTDEQIVATVAAVKARVAS